MLDVVIGRHAWNCQIRTHRHTGYIHTRTHTQKQKVERLQKKRGGQERKKEEQEKEQKEKREKKEQNERNRGWGKKKEKKEKKEGGGWVLGG